MDSTFAEKSAENLRAADLLFEAGMHNASANRAYYAALHAAIEVLARTGTTFGKVDHARVQAKFSGELIHRKKIYPRRLRSYLMDMQSTRSVADYGLPDVSKRGAQRQLNRAKDFVQTVLKEA
jgi:uncharacterized protein (UPF0332 family)